LNSGTQKTLRFLLEAFAEWSIFIVSLYAGWTLIVRPLMEHDELGWAFVGFSGVAIAAMVITSTVGSLIDTTDPE